MALVLKKRSTGIADPTDRRIGGGRALVVFGDDTHITWLRGLKRGFRHCAVLIAVPDGWILHDSMSHMTMISLIKNETAETLVARLLAAGLHTIEVTIHPAPKRFAAPLPFTCVESVKRILGLHAWWIVTPWQLYRYLVRCSKIYD